MNSSRLFIVSLIFKLLPETRFFGIKSNLLKFCGVIIGENVRICSSVRIIGSGNLVIGDNVWIGPQSLISCGGEIIIEDNVDIAPRVYIGTGSHHVALDSIRAAGEGYNGKIIIKHGVWIGASASIIPGKSHNDIRCIGKNSVIGAGALVLSNIDDNVIVAGVPAKVIKEL